MSMIIMPIQFVFGFFTKGFIAMGVWLVTMTILKFTWYDRLHLTASDSSVTSAETAAQPGT
jgi:hypothetical protein